MDKLRKAFWIFALLMLFTAIADRLLFILFPIYLIENNFSATAIGIIFSVTAFILAISKTFLGRLSDKYGRKRLVSIGLLIDTIAIALYPMASKIHEFILVKGIKEIGWSIQDSLKNTLQADSFPRKIRPRYLAKLGIIQPIGRAMAAVTGIIVVTYFSLAFGFHVASIFMFIGLLVFTLFYKEYRIKPGKEFSFNPFGYPSGINFMAIIVFLQTLTFAIVYQPAFFIFANKYLSIPTNTLFVIFLVAYIISAFFVFSVSKRVYSFGTPKILATTLFIVSICYCLYAFAQDVIALSLIFIIIAASFYIFSISFKTVIMDFARPKSRGEELGFVKTIESIGMVIGPLLGGLLIDTIGIQAPFLTAGILLLPTSLALYLKRF